MKKLGLLMLLGANANAANMVCSAYIPQESCGGGEIEVTLFADGTYASKVESGACWESGTVSEGTYVGVPARYPYSFATEYVLTDSTGTRYAVVRSTLSKKPPRAGIYATFDLDTKPAFALRSYFNMTCAELPKSEI